MKFQSQHINPLNYIIGLIFLMLSLLFFSCQPANGGKPEEEKKNRGRIMYTIKGYDLEKPLLINLPLSLSEVSGIVFYDKDTSLFAINDEFGVLQKIRLNQPDSSGMWKFGPPADYEDVVLYDSTFYVLVSNGNILSVKFQSYDSLTVMESQVPDSIQGEFEILYFNPADKHLYLICKDCEGDKKKALTAIRFDPATRTYLPGFMIDIKSLAGMVGKKSMRFKPSAAAIHPITGELFIISAINKLLVVANREGQPVKAYQLDEKIYKQPEGLTFSKGGDLFISNEAADIGTGNILFYPYKAN